MPNSASPKPTPMLTAIFFSFLCQTRDPVGKAGIFFQYWWQDFFLYVADDFAGFHQCLICLRSDLCGALEVEACGFQQALALIRYSNGLERHFLPFRGANEHAVKTVHILPVGAWIAHHHLDFVNPALYPLRFRPVKCVAHLACQIVTG